MVMESWYNGRKIWYREREDISRYFRGLPERKDWFRHRWSSCLSACSTASQFWCDSGFDSSVKLSKMLTQLVQLLCYDFTEINRVRTNLSEPRSLKIRDRSQISCVISLLLKLRPCIPCLWKASTLSARQTVNKHKPPLKPRSQTNQISTHRCCWWKNRRKVRRLASCSTWASLAGWRLSRRLKKGEKCKQTFPM